MCFGDNTYGSKGTANEEFDCNTPCVNDDGIKCGGNEVNSVYDVENANEAALKEQSRLLENCLIGNCISEEALLE